MKRQFSLSTLTVLGCPPPEMIYIAARAGYDFVSLRPIGLSGEPDYGLAKSKALWRQTKTALDSTGLRLLDIEGARIIDGATPKNYEAEMEAAAKLGASCIISNVWTKDRSFVLDAFSEICDLAKPFGLTVVLEFLTWSPLVNIGDVLEVIRDAKRENAGVLVDTLHFHRSRCTLEELDAIPREYFHFAHLCDAPKEIPTAVEDMLKTALFERLYVGEGGIDIAGILNRMPEVPYSLEIPCVERSKVLGYAEYAMRCLETAKAYLDAHG